ncbi:MAG: glycosyltransferase family 4 protein [Gammaproteobacteria bacterium]|nr:glycosyltransferase family 4 protein [Gammaproteobacteria bacterium]
MTEQNAKKILILAANPGNTERLRLDQEVNKIEKALKEAGSRRFQIISKWAVSFEDIYHALLEHEPAIVHFSGHGEGEGGIILEGDDGEAKPLDTNTLAKLFKLFAGSVEYIVLNACYSEIQARAIAEHIEYVIGMSDAMQDEAAIKFSAAFYAALERGKNAEFACELGCVAIQSLGLPGEEEKPALHSRCQQPVKTAALPVEFLDLTVFLALTTDDLYAQRRQVEDSLRQQGVRILPDGASGEITENEIQQADLFVQLLSAVSVREPGPGPAQQAKMAHGLPVIQWRDRGLDLNAVPNPAHRALLEAPAVMANDLDDFKRNLNQYLHDQADRRRTESMAAEQAKNIGSGQLVFVDTAPEDRDFAQRIADYLFTGGYIPCLPLSEVSPRELFADQEGNLKDCDLVILPYRHASPVWVREQLRYCVKMQGKRGGPHRLIALCCHPSCQAKPDLGMALLNLRHLDCAQIQDETCLPAFLRETK